MHRKPNLQSFFPGLLAMAIAVAAIAPKAAAAPPPDRGPGGIHSDDPCTHLPNPPGNAEGIDKQCPAHGSSSGIAKGDFNGDGYADLAIGEPGATINNHASAGDVIVLYGGPNGLTATTRQLWYLDRIPACPVAPVCMGVDYAGVNPHSEAGDLFGSALASGDFNGDGFTDLAIGMSHKTVVQDPLSLFSSTHKESGAVVILYGSKNGLTVTDPAVPPTLLDLNNVSNLWNSDWSWDGAHFGASLAWGNFSGAKDPVSGAPIADLVVGAPEAGETGVFGDIVQPNEGTVVVFPRGQSVGAIVLPPESGTNAFTGAALVSGDFNGDGFSDLAIGASGNFLRPSIGATGAVLVFYGSHSGLNFSGGFQQWTQLKFGSTAVDGDRFGVSLAAGDFNGDGKTDLAIGAPGKAVGSVSGAGVVFVIAGGANGLSTSAGTEIWDQNVLGRGVQAGAQFGTALAAGDFNADGKADLAVGAPLRDIGGVANAGEVDVIFGAATGLSSSAVRTPQFWTQNLVPGASSQTGARFGDSLTAWNFGRNEIIDVNLLGTVVGFPKFAADLAIGAPLQSVDGVSGAGAVNVLYGSFTYNGLVSTNANIWNADTTNIGGPISGAHFGVAVY